MAPVLMGLCLAAALLAPAGPRPSVVLDEAGAEALAADVICGEAGKNEYLADLVAAVISNRMFELAGTRVERATRVLRAKGQFNGSCARHKLTPTAWHRHLAGVLVRGVHADIIRPAWLTPDVRYFSERRTARRWVGRLERAGIYGNMWFFRERRRR